MARFKLNDDSVLTSLDIGSSSVRCLVSRKKGNSLEPLSFYEKECGGFEEGRIVDFREVVPVVGEVLEASESLSNTSFSEVFIGFSSPFHSFQSYGMTALPMREVTRKDIQLAVETACAIPLPDQHARIYINPQEFRVDGNKDILNPLGLSGLRLETEVHIVTIPQFYCQDMTKVLKNLGCIPRGFMNNLIAFGEHLTDSDQKKEGVCLCDIGRKSSRLIVYNQGKVVDMVRIPIGGEHFSLALSKKFKISFIEAENLKKQWGTLQFHSVDTNDQLEAGEDGLFFSYKDCVSVFEEIADLLFQNIRSHIENKELNHKISAGYVFTGSTSLLNGFLERARLHLAQPVSYPKGIDIENKAFKQANIFSISKQFYLKDRFELKESSFNSKWAKLLDLF